MGADVYLNSVHKPAYDKFEPIFREAVRLRRAYKGTDTAKSKRLQAAVDKAYDGMYGSGYFRDNYNGYGLFAQLGLSWWRDVVPMLMDGQLPVECARSLRQRVADAPLDLTSAREVAKRQGDPEPTTAEYEEWRGRLLAILDRSIELEEPLEMSL